MSILRSIRNTLSGGKISSRDSSPVRISRPASLTGSAARRDSLGTRADSSFSRSETFILASDAESQASLNHSNNSTLEKKSKKSKMLSKFSTFSKRKKSPGVNKEESLDHHPSENATNTYYKWQSEGPSTLDYDSQTDPFNFLYEKPSSLMELNNKTNNAEHIRACSVAPIIDSATYRKNKDAKQTQPPKEQAETSKQTYARRHEEQLPPESTSHTVETSKLPAESDKFKTITINSFRKSFRDRLRNQMKDAPHNPAWFVEVEQPEEEAELQKQESPVEIRKTPAKEKRKDFLIFANENYRPLSRSPVRDRSERPLRSSTRSPAKRNETFRADRPLSAQTYSQHPSIRIEIKNSISPNMPGRLVPLGVARPMLATHSTNNHIRRINETRPPLKNSANTKRCNGSAPQTLSKPLTAIGSAPQTLSKPLTAIVSSQVNGYPKVPQRTTGRFQTYVEIRNETNVPKSEQRASPNVGRKSQPTRIQLHGSGTHIGQKELPALERRANNTQHYSTHATPTTRFESHTNRSHVKQPPKTYFGDAQRMQLSALTTGSYSGYSTPAEIASRLHTRSLFAPMLSGYAVSRLNEHTQRSATATPNATSSMTAPVSMQRRSRSPIKMPWR